VGIGADQLVDVAGVARAAGGEEIEHLVAGLRAVDAETEAAVGAPRRHAQLHDHALAAALRARGVVAGLAHGRDLQVDGAPLADAHVAEVDVGHAEGPVAALDAEAGGIGAVDEAVAVVVDAVVAELDGARAIGRDLRVDVPFGARLERLEDEEVLAGRLLAPGDLVLRAARRVVAVDLVRVARLT